MKNCIITGGHPTPTPASPERVSRSPELRHGTYISRNGTKVWISSMTNMLACCSESVCELVDRTVGMTWPIIHPPGFDCPNHRDTA